MGLASMRVLVTGGSGFIGSHLVEALIAGGHEVRCLLRSSSRPGWLEGLAVEHHIGDCTDPASLSTAVARMDWVFHLAGVTRARRQQDYYLNNTQGTYNMAHACVANNPELKRFVLVSSQAAAGPARDGHPSKETDSPRPITAYGQSKLQAEQEIVKLKDSLHSVIIRPSTVFGPRDRDFLEYVRWVKRGLLVNFGHFERTVSMCYVKDLVSGIMAAATQALGSGSIYFLADPRPYPWNEVELACQNAVGRCARSVHLPSWILHGMAIAAETQGRLCRRTSILSRARVAELLEGRWACDASRAMADLDFNPQFGLRAGLEQTVAWYETEGWLPTTSRA
ncbi:MAG TPA: NAD(P)-dependent oxidoreductase [Acidiferrobacteraceae bacterium]|nr:NAD(P)-dependent oxidoreductase [Acidiferrobacteraceae bacterium]